MAVTTGDAGYQQSPSSETTYELLYDVEVSGKPCAGVLVWTETDNVEVYTDTIGNSSNPITVVAGAEKIPLIDGTQKIRKVYVRGAATAKVSWHVFSR